MGGSSRVLGSRMMFWAKSSKSGVCSDSRVISWMLGCGIFGKVSGTVNKSVATSKGNRWLEFTLSAYNRADWDLHEIPIKTISTAHRHHCKKK